MLTLVLQVSTYPSTIAHENAALWPQLPQLKVQSVPLPQEPKEKSEKQGFTFTLFEPSVMNCTPCGG